MHASLGNLFFIEENLFKNKAHKLFLYEKEWNVTSQEVEVGVNDLFWVCVEEASAPERVSVDNVTNMAGQLCWEPAVQHHDMWWLWTHAVCRCHSSKGADLKVYHCWILKAETRVQLWQILSKEGFQFH